MSAAIITVIGVQRIDRCVAHDDKAMCAAAFIAR
jgi:hypothetical protein